MLNIATILEAHVNEEHWAVLRGGYKQVVDRGLPPQIVRTFLLQNKSDPTFWRIMTIWRSWDDLDSYRKSVETPSGVLIFRSVGAEPKLSIFEIPESGTNNTI